MKIPVTGGPEIRVSPRNGSGITIYQSKSRISLTNADVLGLVDAIVETVQRNREGTRCNLREN